MGDRVLAAVLGALIAGPLVALMAWWRSHGRDRAEVAKLRGERDQANADAAHAVTVAATSLIAPLQARIEALEQLVGKQRAELEQLRPLRGEVDRLRGENAALHAQLDGLRADMDKRRGSSAE